MVSEKGPSGLPRAVGHGGWCGPGGSVDGGTYDTADLDPLPPQLHPRGYPDNRLTYENNENRVSVTLKRRPGTRPRDDRLLSGEGPHEARSVLGRRVSDDRESRRDTLSETWTRVLMDPCRRRRTVPLDGTTPLRSTTSVDRGTRPPLVPLCPRTARVVPHQHSATLKCVTPLLRNKSGFVRSDRRARGCPSGKPPLGEPSSLETRRLPAPTTPTPGSMGPRVPPQDPRGRHPSTLSCTDGTHDLLTTSTHQYAPQDSHSSGVTRVPSIRDLHRVTLGGRPTPHRYLPLTTPGVPP